MSSCLNVRHRRIFSGNIMQSWEPGHFSQDWSNTWTRGQSLPWWGVNEAGLPDTLTDDVRVVYWPRLCNVIFCSLKLFTLFLVFRCGRVWMWLKLRARCWERPILLTPCQEPSEGIMLWKWAGQFSDASVPQHLLIITVFNSVKYYLVLILFALCLFCRNVIHGSDSVESAQREISLWFGQDELQCWEDTHNHWLYNWTGLRSEAASHSLNHHLFFFVGLMTSWMTYLSSLYWLQ